MPRQSQSQSQTQTHILFHSKSQSQKSIMDALRNRVLSWPRFRFCHSAFATWCPLMPPLPLSWPPGAPFNTHSRSRPPSRFPFISSPMSAKLPTLQLKSGSDFPACTWEGVFHYMSGCVRELMSVVVLLKIFHFKISQIQVFLKHFKLKSQSAFSRDYLKIYCENK